jgi:hypothetical protein
MIKNNKERGLNCPLSYILSTVFCYICLGDLGHGF